MGNILERYRKQFEEDKLTQDYGDVSEFNYTDNELEEYKRQVDEQRNEINTMENEYKKFQEEYVKISEKELEDHNLVKNEDCFVKIKRIYCPKCGKELISHCPIIYNPYTMEKIAKHECECGFKANLEYAYPRVVYVDKEGNEIKAFTI